MTDARAVVTGFYDAVQRRDMTAARQELADDMTFIGLFETYPNAGRLHPIRLREPRW